MTPNEARTIIDRVSRILIVLGVGILAAGCKASGHVDFAIDLPAVELAVKPPDRSPES